MLLELTVENFRSIKEPLTLSMLASADKSHPDNLLEVEGLRDDRLLRSAVIYGANASGKSNLVIAAALLRNLVLRSHGHQKGMMINYQPFAFDPECASEPTRFEVAFIHRGVRYRYNLAFDRKSIVEENLYHYPKGRRALIFSRNRQKFKFTNDESEQTVISNRTLENVLYLSSSVQFNYQGTTPAYEWFLSDMTVLETANRDPLVTSVIDEINIDRKMKDMVLKAMKIADLGIIDIRGKTRKTVIKLDEVLPSQLLGNMTLTGGEVIENELMFTHSITDDRGEERKYALNFMQESEGTRQFFAIIGPVIRALREGQTLIIDELDANLHPSLTKWLIGLFHDPEQNSKGAQLIFNTHNQQLLDLDSLRRDQIWFVEKEPNKGYTQLFSLYDFGERKDRDVKKAYAQGRYGAVPFISAEKVL